MPLPPTPSPSIKSTFILREKLINKDIYLEDPLQRRGRLEGSHSFGQTLEHSWIAFGLSSMTHQEVPWLQIVLWFCTRSILPNS